MNQQAESEYEAPDFVRVMRPACSECSGPVEWLGGSSDMADVFGFDWVNTFLDGVPGFEWTEDGPELEFWRCRSCGEVGMLMWDDSGCL